MNTDVIIWAVAIVAAITVLSFAVIGGRRALLARRVNSLDPVARAAYDAVLAARTAVKGAERAHKKAVSAKSSRVYSAGVALRKAEGIGRKRVTSFKSQGYGDNKIVLYENEMRTSTKAIPLHGVTMRYWEYGGLTVSSRPTIGRTIAGAAIGHAVGSTVSNRRSTASGLGLAGAIVGANMEKTTVHDSRSTTVYFDVDGKVCTSLVARGEDRAKLVAFCTALTQAQENLADLEARRGPAIATAELELAAAEAEAKPAAAAAIAETARTELARLTAQA